jgi:hypothetical protein
MKVKKTVATGTVFTAVALAVYLWVGKDEVKDPPVTPGAQMPAVVSVSEKVVPENIRTLPNSRWNETLTEPHKHASELVNVQDDDQDILVDDGKSYDLDAIKPFEADAVEDELDKFFGQFLSEASLPEDAVDTFNYRLLATLEHSEYAREVVARFYRNLDEDALMKRDMMYSMLMPSETGQKLLLDEANNILETGQSSRYGDMFEIYSNVEDGVKEKVIERALEVTQTSEDLRTVTSALNYVGKIEEHELSPVQQNQALLSLEAIAYENPDESVRALSAQKTYRLTPANKSSELATEYLTNDPSSAMVVETVNSVDSGDVRLTEELKISLQNALNSGNVTPQARESVDKLLEEKKV